MLLELYIHYIAIWFHPHFLQQQFPGIVFWGPYVTLGVSIVFHGSWCIGSRVSEGKTNDSPVEKTYRNKNRWQQQLIFQICFFPEPFFNVILLWGGGFSKVSNGRLCRWLFRSFESSFHCDDVRRNWHPYNPWSRSTRFRLVDHGREVKMDWDGNQWRFNIRLLWMRKLGVFVLEACWCWCL